MTVRRLTIIGLSLFVTPGLASTLALPCGTALAGGMALAATGSVAGAETGVVNNGASDEEANQTGTGEELWQEEDVTSFVEGDYAVMGTPNPRDPDGDGAYVGWMRLTAEGPELIARRCVGGRVQDGTGRVESVTADHIPVVILSFVSGPDKVEVRYQVHGDLSNYALLSGPTRRPLLESEGWEHSRTVDSIPESCAS